MTDSADPSTGVAHPDPVMRESTVQCAHPGGLHRMAYTEWGERHNPRVVVCVHGLTRCGRDFDRLAAALADRYRVVCPDIVGRGRSDWLPSAQGYQFPQYLADCVTLIARLDVDSVDWVGTSMGGLIGLMLAALPASPVRRLVLNDVGPVIGRAGLQRIAGYAGADPSFDSFEQAVDHVAAVSSSFGPLSRDDWRELTRPVVVERDGRWRLRCDPGIGEGTRAALSQTGAPVDLWPVWDAVRVPTLVLRGAESDLLESGTARDMTRRGPRASLIEFDGVGHAPALLAPDQIAAVRDFLLDGARPPTEPPATR